MYVQLNDVSWGITFTYPLPHTQSFSSLAPKCIKPKPSKFKSLGLQTLEYVKYFNRFQYFFNFKFNYLTYSTHSNSQAYGMTHMTVSSYIEICILGYYKK